MKKLFLLLFIAFTSISCFSEKKLLKAYYKDDSILKNGMFMEVNGTYPDTCCSNSKRLSVNLLENLYFYPKFLDSTNISDVVLHYDGKKQLNVKLMQADTIYKDFNLKVYKRNGYLSIKRNLSLLPIPLFFIQHERKLILFTDNNGALITVLGTQEFAFILFMAGGYDFIKVNRYEKHPWH